MSRPLQVFTEPSDDWLAPKEAEVTKCGDAYPNLRLASEEEILAQPCVVEALRKAREEGSVPFSTLPDETPILYDGRLWVKRDGYATGWEWNAIGRWQSADTGTSFITADGAQLDPLVTPIRQHPD